MGSVMSKFGQELIASVKEALAIARGEAEAPAMLVDGKLIKPREGGDKK
jgi:hypothetical protein